MERFGVLERLVELPPTNWCSYLDYFPSNYKLYVGCYEILFQLNSATHLFVCIISTSDLGLFIYQKLMHYFEVLHRCAENMHVVIATYRIYDMHNFMNAAQRSLAYEVIKIRFSFSPKSALHLDFHWFSIVY